MTMEPLTFTVYLSTKRKFLYVWQKDSRDLWIFFSMLDLFFYYEITLNSTPDERVLYMRPSKLFWFFSKQINKHDKNVCMVGNT